MNDDDELMSWYSKIFKIFDEKKKINLWHASGI